MLLRTDDHEKSSGATAKLSSESERWRLHSSAVSSEDDEHLLSWNHGHADITETEKPIALMQQDFDFLSSQLHPAVSLELHRVSSCYFSIASDRMSCSDSVADLLSLFPEEEGGSAKMEDAPWNHPADLLFPDVAMHVLSFLDRPSLAAFSETARRPNLECFHFLQLQLQRALMQPSNPSELVTENDEEFSLEGISVVRRLVKLDRTLAGELVQEYVHSNVCLSHTLPLSLNLAYIRRWLQQHALLMDDPCVEDTDNVDENGNRNAATSTHQQQRRHRQQQAMASAALFFTLLGGAASFLNSNNCGTDTCADSMPLSLDQYLPDVTELQHLLFRLGFVGSLMGATKRMVAMEDPQKFMRERAEALAASMQENMPNLSLSRLGHAAYRLAYEFTEHLRSESNHHTATTPTGTMSADAIASHQHQHPPATTTSIPTSSAEAGASCAVPPQPPHELEPKKLPSGCVGAYARTVTRATRAVKQIIKKRRAAQFYSLSAEQQAQLSTAFIDACASDDALPLIRDLVSVRECMDVDGFYVGTDGTETCALHTSAYAGSCRVLDFLCRGLYNGDQADNEISSEDGGLCNVNLRDANGWTALHFAAGGNSVQAARILLQHGAAWDVEAHNGYTPLQWAVRLQNAEVAEELRQWQYHNSAKNNLKNSMGWMSGKPLTSIANRFLALIPTH